MATSGPVRAFLSYAHEDHAWRDRVLKQLGWLVNSGQLQAFDDRQIKPGEQWDPRIRAELEAASIIIVLISEHFVGSKYCTIEELVRAVERQRSGTADFIAIYCDWVDLGALPVAAHQVVPQDEKNDLKPLAAWGEKKASLPLSRIAAAVRGMVEARRPKTADPAAAPAAAVAALSLPPRGRFVGRDTDLDQLRAWILDESAAPIAVLGAGGIGKSKLTIAALVDSAVATRFGDRRLFVRLEDVGDETGIYGAVARELTIDPGPRPAATVAAALREAPALIALDNAETPWEADLGGAEQAFARLAELPGVRLLVSLRGFELPGVANWRPILIEPLHMEPARALFLAIAGNRYDADSALSELLRRLDGLPLAIELVAHRAQAEPDAATVLRHWESERGRFAKRGQGGRKELDLGASIALSLASPRMSEHGRRLFALLGRLPQGLARADAAAVMPQKGANAAVALTHTGLVLRDPGRLRMLAPVRQHAESEPLAPADREMLVIHFGKLADDLPLRWTYPEDPVLAHRALSNLSNIEAVLDLTQESSDAIRRASAGWRRIRIGDAWHSFGNSEREAVAYEKACRQFEVSSETGIQERDPKLGLATSLGRLFYVQRSRGNVTLANEPAERSYIVISELLKEYPNDTDVLHELTWSIARKADIHCNNGLSEDALDLYKDSLRRVQELVDREPENDTLQRDLAWYWGRISDVHGDEGRLDKAIDAADMSYNVSLSLVEKRSDDHELQHDLVVSLVRRGRLLSRSEKHAEVLKLFEASIGISVELCQKASYNVRWKNDLRWSLTHLGNSR